MNAMTGKTKEEMLLLAKDSRCRKVVRVLPRYHQSGRKSYWDNNRRTPSTASSGKRRTRTSPNCQSLSTAFARTRVSLHGKQKTIRTEQECGGKNRRGAGSKGRESNNGVRWTKVRNCYWKNKQILLAEKFGWDTVECYTEEPLPNDLEVEKRIKKTVKESKRIRAEKKKKTLPRSGPPKSLPWQSRPQPEQKVVFKRHLLGPSYGQMAGKPSASRHSGSVCFRCFRPGHFAWDCRATVTWYWYWCWCYMFESWLL